MTTFTDITKSSRKAYRIDTPGTHVFFLHDRSCDITFDLTVPGAEAHVFALFEGNGADAYALGITQHHVAPDTVSHVLVKSVLEGTSSFDYHGIIRIDRKAERSDASQTDRNLILSQEVRASSKPELEILADDVTCRHAAATGAPDPETLWYMRSRGLTPGQAETLYAAGFVNDLFREMEKIVGHSEWKNKISKWKLTP